jgi:hypothetical protein
MISLGIDPGSSTGFAIAEDGNLIVLCTVDFWDAIYNIDSYPDAIVVVELPDTRHIWHTKSVSRAAIGSTGIRVGSCLREAELIIKYLHKKNRDYVIQKPLGKINADEFKCITGWKGKSNQHERDAAMLALSICKG